MCSFCPNIVNSFINEILLLSVMKPEHRTALQTVLENIRPDEKQHYVNIFHREDPSRFALIKVSGQCIEASLEKTVFDLDQLRRENLFPSVLIGWGNILTKRLEEEGIETRFVNGNRYTDGQTLEVLKEVVEGIAKSFVAFGEMYGVKIHDLTSSGIISAKQLDPSLGYVGEVTGIDTMPIRMACENGGVPLLAPIGYDENGQMYNINADNVGRELILNLHPSKYVVLTPPGGVWDSNGKLLSKISIVDDYDDLVANGILTGGMLKKVDEAKQLLEELNNGYAVQLTSPMDLLTELLTYKGSGTKIVLGYHTSVHDSFQRLEQTKLEELFGKALGKKVIDHYFETEQVRSVIVEEDYDGAIVLEDQVGSTYMDKFAVTAKSREMGLGTKLFTEALDQSENGMFWRSSVDNPFNPWYFRRIQQFKGGCQVDGDWIVYWIGTDPEKTQDLVQYAANKEKTMVDDKDGK
jgi:acetylglutamate kinase